MKFASGDRVMAYPSIPPLLNPVMTRQPSRTALYTAVSGKIEQVRFLAFKRQKGCANEFGCSIYTKSRGEKLFADYGKYSGGTRSVVCYVCAKHDLKVTVRIIEAD